MKEFKVDHVYQCGYFGETSGEKLDGLGVERARREDIAYFKQVGVYKQVSYREGLEATEAPCVC